MNPQLRSRNTLYIGIAMVSMKKALSGETLTSCQPTLDLARSTKRILTWSRGVHFRLLPPANVHSNSIRNSVGLPKVNDLSSLN